jgi:Uma2 family endonuclease
MQRHPQRHYSIDDYFAVELNSPIKHEYYDGEIFAMAGASVAHNHITANVLGALRTALRGTQRSAFGSDLRLTTPAGLFTYPDVMVICDQIDLTRDRPDTVTNAVLVVEVLSEATRDYDRGEKFTLYKSIPTLRNYLLIEQEKLLIEHHALGSDAAWTATRVDRRDASIDIASVPVTLRVADVYDRVFT